MLFLGKKKRLNYAVSLFFRFFKNEDQLERREVEKEIANILKEGGAKQYSEHVIVALAVIIARCKKDSVYKITGKYSKEVTEEAINDAVSWLGSLTENVAAMYLYRDITCLTSEGAKKYFRNLLEKYCYEDLM